MHQHVIGLAETILHSSVLLNVLLMVVNALWGVLSMRRLTLVLSWRIALRVRYCDDIMILLDHMISCRSFDLS